MEEGPGYSLSRASAQESPLSHLAYVRRKFRVTWGPPRVLSRGPWRNVPHWLQVSEGLECGQAGLNASLPSCCFPWISGMSAGWEFSQQRSFPVRTTDSSWSLGTAPTWVGTTRESRDGC